MPDAHDDNAAQNRRQEILNWQCRQFLQRLGVLGVRVAIADRLLHPHQQVNAETNLSPTSQATPIKAKAGVVTVQEALRYAMSVPVATTVSGIDSLQVLRQNLNIAKGFTPMNPEEMQAVRSRYATDARRWAL
jgi:aryl-alcohol dehydrogenase-like predicted oxidoreductase